MRESTGNLWTFGEDTGKTIWRVITTNGFVKRNGCAVMGRGCAREAAQRYPGIDQTLGSLLREHGNQVLILGARIVSFPVKHNWWEDADPALIAQSALDLGDLARKFPDDLFVMPRPGCGNGRLSWTHVRPLLGDLPDNVVAITFEEAPRG
jgi:hypothetical protein